MATTDKKKIAELISEVEKKYGKGSIYTLDSKYENAVIPRVSSGIADLDESVGGGIPEGRLIELYGVNQAGKTSLAYHLLGKYDLGLFVDMEGTFDAARAKLFGCRKNQLLIRRPAWGEQAMDMIFGFAEAGCPLIVVDSLPAMIPRKEFEEDNMEKHTQMAMVASMLSRKLPKLCYLCETTGSTVIFINQVRSKFGVLFGDPYDTPGGNAIKHYCSLRIQLARKQWLTHDKLGHFGQITRLRVVKSKVCQPFMEAELVLIFERGFVKHEDVPDIRKEMLREIREGRREAADEEEVPDDGDVQES